MNKADYEWKSASPLVVENQEPVREQKPSIKINRGMNGKVGWELKAYQDEPENLKKFFDDAIKVLVAQDERLQVLLRTED